MSIVFSGPLANILFGILIITTLYSFHGRYEVKPEVNQVLKNSPADRAGLKPNDLILSIDNIKINNFDDIRKVVTENNKLLSFKVLRNKEKYKFEGWNMYLKFYSPWDQPNKNLTFDNL